MNGSIILNLAAAHDRDRDRLERAFAWRERRPDTCPAWRVDQCAVQSALSGLALVAAWTAWGAAEVTTCTALAAVLDAHDEARDHADVLFSARRYGEDAGEAYAASDAERCAWAAVPRLIWEVTP